MVPRFFSDRRQSYESDLLEELRSVICDGCFDVEVRGEAGEIIEELERRAHLREVGYDHSETH